jgi:cytochrome P450
VIIGISNGKEVGSVVSIRDEARHGALRRAVNGAFTPTGVLDYEYDIDKTIGELLKLLAGRTSIDLSAMLLYYSMDAANRFSFGTPLGCLAADGDVDGAIQLVRDRFVHWGKWASLPRLESLIFRNPTAMRMTVGKPPVGMVAAAMKQLQSRLGQSSDSTKPTDLLSKFLVASEAHPETLDTPGVIGMLMSTISGAGDTTATSLTAIFYHLMKKPSTMEKLKEELSAAELDCPVPSYQQVAKLPYLAAVIREGMRLFPIASMPLGRVVPAGGAIIAGTFLPEGTNVGCMFAALHLDKSVFGDDAEDFKPERWLTTDASSLRAMEAAHMGFSRGKRVCLGQHIAVLQMKKVIPALVQSLEVGLVGKSCCVHC